MGNRGIMGRYSTDKERALAQYHMKIYEDQRTALDSVSKRLKLPMSELIRIGIDAMITVADDCENSDTLFDNTSNLLKDVDELSKQINQVAKLQDAIEEIEAENYALNKTIDELLSQLKDTDENAYRAGVVGRHGGNVAAAADALGVSRQTVYNSLQSNKANV